MSTNRPLVIYHANCTDGFSAAWVFHRLAGGLMDFHPAAHGSAPPDVAGRVVFMADFSYPRDVMRGMLKTCQVMTVLDHHESAEKELAGLDQEFPLNLVLVFDMNRSGAGIAWDHMFKDQPRPVLLDYVEDRDLWKFKLPLSKEVSSYVGSLPKTFAEWDVLMSGDHTRIAKHSVAGSAILRKHEKECADVVRRAAKVHLLGHDGVPVANCPGHMASDVGHLLGEGAPFAMTYFIADGKAHFSLRSRADGVNVADIAGLFKGGGHAHASGFVVPVTHWVFCLAVGAKNEVQ